MPHQRAGGGTLKGMVGCVSVLRRGWENYVLKLKFQKGL